jgi:hypothetical protein
MDIKDPRICARCVMPESPPEIVFDSEGVCSLCRAHGTQPPGAPAPLETEFATLLARNKGKKDYDCMVMCSGGKDSTAALYYMKTRYRARTLAFTFDNGFETDEAMGNITRAVDKLGVDFLLFRTDFMKDVFSKILKTGSRAVICHLCSIWYMDLALRTAARHEIPVIIAGWTRGQSVKNSAAPGRYAADAPEFSRMAAATREFIRQHLKPDPRYKDFPESMEEVLARAGKKHKCLLLSPHWFLPQEADEYTALVQKELGWKYPKLSYPAKSTNCLLNYISVHNSMKHYGYTHYHVEMSKLIREGALSRAEALELLKLDFGRDLLTKIAAPLGCAIE